MDLSQHATAVTGGFLDALPYFILVGLVVVTGFLQARQSRRNAPNMNSQMAIITSILPIGFGLFSLQFPAGLVLYFLVSNLWRLGQQEIIMRKITRPGQAALAASAQKDDAIDVEGGDTSAFPRAAGGLRKLFQIPAAANGGEPAADAGNGTENGAKNGAKNGAAKPSGGNAGAAKGATAKGASAKGTAAKGTQASSSSSTSSSGSGAASAPGAGTTRSANDADPAVASHSAVGPDAAASTCCRRAERTITWSGWRRPVARSRKHWMRRSTSWVSTRKTSSTRCSRSRRAGSSADSAAARDASAPG